MAGQIKRKIVRIDETRCNGCGQCVPGCAEGAIRIIDGKARLVAENLCDGLGACLGECPQGAITIEERQSEAFDASAVEKHRQRTEPDVGPTPSGCPSGGGCPGTMMRLLQPKAVSHPTGEARSSQLRQWPVQLALVPSAGAIWKDADVLIAADCVAYAMGDFHERLLPGKTLAIACPKLDDVGPYIDKLTSIFAGNDIRSITVASMEVPCCFGIIHAVVSALDRAGRGDIPLNKVTVKCDGTVRESEPIEGDDE